MRPISFKIAFVASVSLALALTFSCSSSSDEQTLVTSSSSELSSSLSSSSTAESSSSVAVSSSSVQSSSSVVASSSSVQSSSSVVVSSSSEEPSSSSEAESSSSEAILVKCNPTADQRKKRTIDITGTGRSVDLTLPSTGEGPFPVIMFAFGGGFTGGGKTVGAPFNNGTNHGYATVALEYRLASSNNKSFPGLIEDVLAEIRYLRAHANELCLDPNKFAMSGFSAGGYVTGLINSISGSTNPKHPFSETSNDVGVSSEVQASVSCAALTDFTKLNSQQQELGGKWQYDDHYKKGLSLNLFFGEDVIVPPPSGSTIEKLLKDSNPFTYITQANCAKLPPIMMVHGTSDNLVPWKQSEILVNKINEVCGSGKAQLVKHNGGHSDCPSGNETEIFNFLDSKLGITR